MLCRFGEPQTCTHDKQRTTRSPRRIECGQESADCLRTYLLFSTRGLSIPPKVRADRNKCRKQGRLCTRQILVSFRLASDHFPHGTKRRRRPVFGHAQKVELSTFLRGSGRSHGQMKPGKSPFDMTRNAVLVCQGAVRSQRVNQIGRHEIQ